MIAKGLEEVKVLGVTVNNFTVNSLKKLVGEIIQNDEKYFIGNHNLHSVYLYHKNEQLGNLYAETPYIHIDGMPLVWIGKLLGYPLKKENRITYIDWFPIILNEAKNRGWKIFYLGSRPGIAKKGANKFKAKYPSLNIKTRHGYFDMRHSGEENTNVVDDINEFNPDILFVGMGMPRQETWIKENINKINANVVLNAGACIDYFAGEVPLPPRWLGLLGLEWLYRFVHEPGRLAKRYLYEPWSLIPFLLKDLHEAFLAKNELKK